jgi:hypothetical protein
MIGQTISHYAPKAHPPLADRILEKLGEVPKSPTSVFSPEGPKGIPLEDASPRVIVILRIPPLFGGRGERCV